MRIFNTKTPAAEEALREIETRGNSANENAARVADEMIAGVRARGDAYVAEQIARFDRVDIAPVDICVTSQRAAIDPKLADAIELAIARVDAFHRQQMPASYTWASEGTVVEHRVRPLRRVGVYVPGGRAVYLSTLIMCAVPAKIAGVEEIVVATTPAAAEKPELQYACARLGVKQIYRCGGAAGVAALALGTESIERVDKIVGPGNSYVTAAKARLLGQIGIDMTAGPTELVVIADETADAELIASDLAAQGEHGPDSAVICIATSESIAKQIADAAMRWAILEQREKNDFRAQVILVAQSLDEAVAIADRIAPEHLSIHTASPAAIAAKAQNCGAIYCGPWAPPASGDYIVGSNHVLPTSGSARFFSPLGVYDFVKRTNVVTLSEDAILSIAPAGERLAYFEGLPNHARSMETREAKLAERTTRSKA